MPPKKKAKFSQKLIDEILAEGNPEEFSDSDDGSGYSSEDNSSGSSSPVATASTATASAGDSKLDPDLSALDAELQSKDEADEMLNEYVKQELPGLIEEVLKKLSPSDKLKYAQILNEKLIEKPYHLYQFLNQVKRSLNLPPHPRSGEAQHPNPLLEALLRTFFLEDAKKTRIREILTNKTGGFLPSPTDALNAVNPFNQSYIDKLEILNLNGFLSMIGSPTQLPGKIKSGVQNMLSANYLAMGKAIIDVFAGNEELQEKAKELGFELYGVVGDGALFITEKHDGYLKTFLEKTSYIGNFLMIPSKTLGVVVFNILMGVAGTVPGVAAGYRVLKLGKKFFEVSGKTLELALRIGTGNWEEFNNLLQLLMEAAVMIPKGIYKFFNIFRLGISVITLLAKSGASAATAIMSSAQSEEKVAFNDITENLDLPGLPSLPGMGDSEDGEEEEEEDMGLELRGDDGDSGDKDEKEKKKKGKLTKKNMKNMKKVKNMKKTKKKKKKKR